MAQIVLNIVVAIFVFAVGTAFVVAQVVPPARGTRATSTLQGADGILRRACSGVDLRFHPRCAYSLPMGRCDLGGYLVRRLPLSLVSLWAMMNILFDATDPRRFKKPLLRKARRATQARRIIGRRRGKRSMLVLNLPFQPSSIQRRRGNLTSTSPARTCTVHRVRGWVRAVSAWWHKRVRQGVTDELHEIVRTARGW